MSFFAEGKKNPKEKLLQKFVCASQTSLEHFKISKYFKIYSYVVYSSSGMKYKFRDFFSNFNFKKFYFLKLGLIFVNSQNKYRNFSWLKLIFEKRPCFLGPSKLETWTNWLMSKYRTRAIITRSWIT